DASAVGPARPDSAPLVEAGRPLAGQPPASAEAPLPSPPAVPGPGGSPVPTAADAPAPTGRSPFATPPAATATAPSPAAPAPAASADDRNPVAPAPTPTGPPRPDPGDAATPTASATPTQSTQPTQQPKPQLPPVAQITGTNGALDNYSSLNQDGNMVGTYTANGTPAQLWELQQVGEGMYYLRNASSNFTKVLDQDRRSGSVQIWTSPPSGWNQVWAVSPVQGGYRLSNAESKMCLTSEGIGLGAHVTPCSGAANQVWTFS
ncbi:RICIN domain-containing protein, partial [Kitasatospora sp. NPDC005856]|uniref:RICIN domain-containing protein n=1 Tax=Kitasatospora sp. NPDC005856 TaxID=3154566 RepID=UPI0033D393F5